MTELRRHTALDGLVETLDRVLDGGAAVAGDVIVSVAGVDLLRVDLRLLVQGVRTESLRTEGIHADAALAEGGPGD